MSCTMVGCVFNEKEKKGMCVGIGKDPNNIIQLCWIKERPAYKKPCNIQIKTSMAPNEALGLGALLIRSTVYGDLAIKEMEKWTKKENQPSATPK